MMSEVAAALQGCDLTLYLVDAGEQFGGGEAYIIRMLEQVKAPVFLILNKIDLLEKQRLLPLIAEYAARGKFAEIIPCSALQGENTQHLLDIIYRQLPSGPKYYPDDMISDLPENMLIAELVREQFLRLTNEEVPHSLAVTVPVLEERKNGLLYVEAVIYVERESQKGIIIGKHGALLKQGGSLARAEIEKIFGCRCYLELRVRAKKDWRNNTGLMNSWEYRE
jgi:GTP-binding protein Era